MSGRENIVGQCVSVEKVPTGLKEDLRVKICEHLQLSHRDKLNVPLKEIPGYHTDSELCRCIFLLDSKLRINYVSPVSLQYTGSSETGFLPRIYGRWWLSAHPGNGQFVHRRCPMEREIDGFWCTSCWVKSIACVIPKCVRGADKLCEEVKQEILENYDGKSFELHYERSIECEIPDEWIQMEAASAPGGPGVPPHIPRSTHHPAPAGMATFYQNVPPGQQQGQNQGQYPGPAPFLYPGQYPAASASSVPGQGPGPVSAGMGPGMQHLFMGRGQPGKQHQGQGWPRMPPGYFSPHVQQGEPFYPMPYGYPPFMPFSPQRFPMPPKPGDSDQNLHGQAQGQPGQPSMPFIPWAPSPQMYPGMYNQHVQPHETDQQPHSGPPPPYNGSLPDQMDQAHHDSETEEKHAMEEHKLDELKEPIGRDHDNVPHAVSDQEDYMRRLNRKIQEEQSGKDSDKAEISKMTNNELRQELLEHFKSIGPITDSVRHFYENKLRTVRQSAQSAEDEADGTEKSPDSSSSFEILGTEGQAESDEPQCTIQVTHIPLSVSSEYLQIYFETPKRSGGDDIKELIFKDGDETAFITYETEEVARNVAGRDHYLNQELVQVCLYKPIPPASTNQQNSEQDKGPSRQESETEENPSMIVVRNLPPSASEEYIEMFFENAKRQGGGPVKKVEQYPDDRLAYVEFENPEAVETVLEKLPITMDGHELAVEVYIPTEEEPVSLCTIMVRGPPKIIASDMLEMYFESGRRSGGGDITDIQREADVAYITFASEEVAQRVVERGQHKVNKKTVEVSLYQPNKQVKKQTSTDETEPPQPSEPSEPLCIVRVEGISHVRSMDTLQFYFENTRRSGGGPISEFEVYKEDDTAYITFEEEEAARRVTERGDHTVEGQCIHATLYEPVRPTNSQQDEEEEPLCSIKVMGISKVASKDMLEFYFENARKSGGGSIRELQVHEEEDYAYVTFGGEDVAKRVVDRAHRVDNVDLHVALYRPPKPRPPCTDRLIIKGVSPTTTKDCLFNFLEAKSGASPTQLVYGETEGTVMVTFDSEPDFEKLVKVCERRPLEGSTLSVSKARVSNCIMVSGLKASTTSDTVHYYFENRKRSNGGDIEKVKMSEEPGSCLVLFQNYSVVDDVMKKKHKLEGEELTVQVYIEELGMCQGNGSEPRIKIPDNITIDNIEEKIVDFMKMNDSCKEAINKQLEGCYAKVVWPEKGTLIMIECEITVKTPEFRKLVKDWKRNVERNFMDYVNLLSCKEHPVWDEGWDDVYKGLGELSIDNPDAVAVFVDKKEKKIRVVGYKHVVESVSKSVDKVIKNVSDEIEMRKQTVKQTISNLKPLQLRMLLASKYPNKMEDKFQKLKVKINQNKNELIYEGVQPDIQAAKVEMYEQINSYSMRVLENIPQNCIDLFHSKPVKDYIVKKLKSQKLVGVWEATDNKLAISSYESSLSNCVEFISESVQEKVIPVKRESSSVLTSQQWIDRITEIHTKNSGVCKINCKEDFTKVYITATDDLVDELYGTVAKFLKQHTILHEVISLGNKSIVRLIQSHHIDKLGEISKDLTTHYVQIQCDSRGITVQGTEEGLQLAKERLMKFANQLEKKEHQIKRPGLASHMASDKGQENIKSVESTYPVVIKMGRGEEETEFATFRSGKSTQGPDIGANIYAGGDAYDDRKVYTAEGDMSQIRVDVIVNSADSSISLSGGLGKVLATKGGNVITTECKDYVRKFGKLNTGDVFISSGGNLPSQFIVHASCPHWENGRRKEDEILKEVVFKAMQLATVKAARSIAIPALGCGNYGFPLKVATEIIANAVKDFFREVQESTIMEVFLVDVKPVTVEAFTEAIKNVFDNVREMSPARSNSDDDQRSYRPVPQPRRSMPQHGDSSSSDDDDGDSGTDRSAAFGGISVDVVKAEIASAKVDVIVNTTGKNLDLRNGAVSASLLRAGGDTLQNDLNKNYPKGLADDEIAISVGGNLNCSNVFHGSMMNWDGGGKAVPALHKLMSCCLQEADKRKAKSIAFPAIGTGQLGFPRDIVAKEMFSAISNFASKNPKSSIKEVKFFIYQKDFATVKAFEFEKKNWSGGRRQSKRASRDVGPLHPRKMHDDDGEWVKVASPKADGSLDIGGISISVSQGDITQAKEDCIINSSNEELDLGRGAVAKALLAKGGDKLRKEAASKASEMKQNQFAMTSAPGLPCKCIIHVVAQDSEAEWKSVIEKCLKMADDNKVQSIAFPALGTGMNTKPKDSAKMTLKAVQSFVSQSPRNLKRVNFIIFQDKMMKEFKQAISSFKTEKSSSMLGDAWKYVKGKFDDRFGRQTSRSDGGSLQTNLGADLNVVNFIFYSLSMNDIDSAITKLEKLIDSELVSRILKDSFVEQLTKDQIRELQAMAFQQQVELNIKQDQKQLTMAGISKHVMDFTDKVQRFLREMERFENEKSQAELLKNVVQWYFIEITDVGQNLVNYTPQLNFRIEKAFKEQKSKLQFQDAEGDTYEIDFAALEEYPVSNPKDTVKILRKDLIKESAGGVEIPSSWTTMGKTENLKVVTLQTTDTEYQSVVTQFNATGGGNFNVIKIDRVQNMTLYQQYQARKKLLDQQNPSGTQNERILWHGTAPEAVDSINAHGFNRSYCGKNATAYGDGVYFAVQVSYSASNTYSRPDPNGVKRMYLTRVLTGEYILGKSGMRVPPQKPSAAASHALYDSVVNNVQNPVMFIIFNDTQAYPDYLITFKPK